MKWEKGRKRERESGKKKELEDKIKRQQSRTKKPEKREQHCCMQHIQESI